MGNTEDEFSLCDLWPERDGGFFPDYFSLLWWLYVKWKLHALLMSRFWEIDVTDHFVVIDKIGLFGLDQTSACSVAKGNDCNLTGKFIFLETKSSIYRVGIAHMDLSSASNDPVLLYRPDRVHPLNFPF